LGNRLDDYGVESLEQAMGQHQYYLQYLIYSLALHRYLQRRIAGYRYEQFFGGVYYLFLRGMSSTAPTGIYFDRPSEDLIHRLDAICSGAELGALC